MDTSKMDTSKQEVIHIKSLFVHFRVTRNAFLDWVWPVRDAKISSLRLTNQVASAQADRESAVPLAAHRAADAP